RCTDLNAHGHLHSFPTRRSSDLVEALARRLVERRQLEAHRRLGGCGTGGGSAAALRRAARAGTGLLLFLQLRDGGIDGHVLAVRSEEHTSELQSLAYLVCRLLLE